MLDNLLELKGIYKYYFKKPTLHDLSLCIKEKQSIALVGENGTGKSTLLRIIAGLIKPDRGKVVCSFNNIEIGFVPERFSKDVRFTINEYLTHMGQIRGMPKHKLKARINSLLKIFQLSHARQMRIKQLSKGMIQKVAIMQAILKHPDLLILDEPLSGLDVTSQDELINILHECKEQGMTLIFTCHDSKLIKKVSTRVLQLKDGTIKYDNNVQDIINPYFIIEVKLNTEIKEKDIKKMDGVFQTKTENNCLTIHVKEEKHNSILSYILSKNVSILSVNICDELKQILTSDNKLK